MAYNLMPFRLTSFFKSIMCVSQIEREMNSSDEEKRFHCKFDWYKKFFVPIYVFIELPY
jgi:hypothetical protein